MSLSLWADGVGSPGCNHSTLWNQLRKPVLARRMTWEKLRLKKRSKQQIKKRSEQMVNVQSLQTEMEILN